MAQAASQTATISIAIPSETIAKARLLAEREANTISDVVTKALDMYEKNSFADFLEETRRYAATRNPHGYTEQDIPRLIKEIRAESNVQAEPDKAK